MALVIVGGEREGNKDRRLPRRSQFGESAGARAADDEIRLGEGSRHIVDKGDHSAIEAGSPEIMANLLVGGNRAGLVNEADLSPAPRNRGQLSCAALFSVREPRLPPVISTVSRASWGF